LTRLLLFVLLLVTVACGSAPLIAPPPTTVHGVQVEYRTGDFPGPGLGGARWEDGVPIVLLEDMDGVDPAVQWYTWGHEVCHNEQTDDPSHVRTLHEGELAADCCAGAWLSKLRIEPLAAVERLASFENESVTHPLGAVRASMLLSCWLLKGD